MIQLLHIGYDSTGGKANYRRTEEALFFQRARVRNA